MKKVFIWIGISAVVLVIVLVATAVYATWEKTSWDEATQSYVKSTVLRLNKLDHEQLTSYWGLKPPGTPEERKKIIEYASSFGELVKIKDISATEYSNSVPFFGNGVTHFYTYEATTNFTSGTVVFKFWLKCNSDKIDVLNMNISRIN